MSGPDDMPFASFHKLLEEDPVKVLHMFIQHMGKIASVDESDMERFGRVKWAQTEIDLTKDLLNRFSLVRSLFYVVNHPKLETIKIQLGTVMECTFAMANKWIETMEQVKVAKVQGFVAQVLIAFSEMMTWDDDLSARENYRKLTAVSMEWNESIASGSLIAVLDDKLDTVLERAKAHPEDEVLVGLSKQARVAHHGAEQSVEVLQLLTEMMDIYLRAFRVLPEVVEA